MKKIIKIITFLLIISCFISVFAQSTKKDDILKLIKVSGTEQQMELVIDTVIEQFIQTANSIGVSKPTSFWTSFKNNQMKPDVAKMLAEFVPLYDKHFTHDEIKAAINFYESAAGKKIVQTQPLLMQEGMLIGQKYGEKWGEYLIKELY